MYTTPKRKGFNEATANSFPGNPYGIMLMWLVQFSIPIHNRKWWEIKKEWGKVSCSEVEVEGH